jgi:CheY-like chemotaxis protein
MLHRQRVLAVEPDEDMASLYAALLTTNGADFRVTSSGAEALAEITETWAPQVLLVHRWLPDMTAAELALAVRAKSPRRVRVVCTTAEARPGALDDVVRDAGFDAVLVKPIDIDVLLRALGTPGIAAP